VGSFVHEGPAFQPLLHVAAFPACLCLLSSFSFFLLSVEVFENHKTDRDATSNMATSIHLSKVLLFQFFFFNLISLCPELASCSICFLKAALFYNWKVLNKN
jgi:hypothetical protein